MAGRKALTSAKKAGPGEGQPKEEEGRKEGREVQSRHTLEERMRLLMGGEDGRAKNQGVEAGKGVPLYTGPPLPFHSYSRPPPSSNRPHPAGLPAFFARPARRGSIVIGYGSVFATLPHSLRWCFWLGISANNDDDPRGCAALCCAKVLYGNK